MELRHLRCFIAVAEERSFSRAAERLHIEQSPLSRTIKKLESDLGVVLFQRTSRGTRLTWAGEVFLEDARRVLVTLEQAKTNAKAAATGYRGTLRVALSDGIARTRLSALLALCREEEPEVEIRLFEMAVTGAAVAAIPCGTDLRQMRMEIDSTRIADPVLAQEVADFTHDCYGPARARLFMSRPTLSEEQMNDVTWIGSRFFLDTAGFYDTYRSRGPRDAWPYDDTRDAGLAEVSTGGGYPTCRQWWADSGDGLRDRLLAQVDPGLLSRLGQWAGFLSQTQADDAVIRAIASPRQQVMNQGHVYTDYGGQIGMTLPNVATRVVSDVGLTVGSLGMFPAMDVVRQALPMILSFLKMAMVICIPLVLIFGTYDLRTVVTVTAVQFSLFFVDFWFQLARWIDSTILNALYGWHSPHSNFNPLMGLNNAFGDMLLNFVMATMFIILPGFWVVALTWAGVRTGNILGGFITGTTDAKSAGGSGSRLAMAAATKGAAK